MNDHVNGTMAGILNSFVPKEAAPPSVPVHAVVGRARPWRDCLNDDIYVELWGGLREAPNAVVQAFREAVVKTAGDICHECGEYNATVRFCADTIAEWMRDDTPNSVLDRSHPSTVTERLTKNNP